MKRIVVLGLCAVVSACSRHSEPEESQAQLLQRIQEAAAVEAQAHFDAALGRYARSAGEDDRLLVTVRLPAEGAGPLVLGLGEIERTAGGYAGVIERPSENYPEFVEGARVSFPEDVVADWVLDVGGSPRGNFILRGMLCEFDGRLEDAQRVSALRGGDNQLERAMAEAGFTASDFDGVCDPFDPAVLG